MIGLLIMGFSWSGRSWALWGEALGLQMVHGPTARALDGQFEVTAFGQLAAALATANIGVKHLQALIG